VDQVQVEIDVATAQGERLIQSDPAQKKEDHESGVVTGCLSKRDNLIVPEFARKRGRLWKQYR